MPKLSPEDPAEPESWNLINNNCYGSYFTFQKKSRDSYKLNRRTKQ
ncbi:hypothetical protein [Listeria booriae]|nr:hypothetical protein [Listeria booriae]MBC6152467.1 hypothetical protein [Listeria booriae]